MTIGPRTHIAGYLVSFLVDRCGEVKPDSDQLSGWQSRSDSFFYRHRVRQTWTVKVADRPLIEALVVMISPFAPHTAEELWQMLGHAEGLTQAPWPTFDAEVAKAEAIVVPVQINGKVRARLTVRAGSSDDELRDAALADEIVKSHTAGKTVRKVVIGKGPLVSVVVQ